MDRSPFHGSARRSHRNHPQYGPVLIIVVLLACWLVIAQWPELMSSVLKLAH